MKPSALLQLNRRRSHPTLAAMSARRPLNAIRQRANARLHDGSVRASALAAGPIHDGRPSLDDFVRRAATEAEGDDAAVLELGSPDQGNSQHFQPGHYHWLDLPAATPKVPLSELPVGDGQFGIALCTEAVASSSEPQGVLSEINRALRPNGRLFLAAPLIVPDASHGYLPGRPRFGLNYLLEASGFVIEELQALERTRSYGVVATKRRRPGHDRVG